LKKKYRNHISKTSFSLSHKDCILITYADSIYTENEKTLTTLNTFAKEYFNNKINTIHLLPFYPYSSDDGFSVIDYYKVKKEFGNWNTLKKLNENFSLMYEAVVNHISQHSDWFENFLNETTPFQDYFIIANPKLDYSTVTRPRALPLLHTFKKNEEEIAVWTTFSKDQVDLNYANYKVFLHILDVLLFYISNGALYIRLDAIAFLWKKIGTTCLHLEETHLVIKAL